MADQISELLAKRIRDAERRIAYLETLEPDYSGALTGSAGSDLYAFVDWAGAGRPAYNSNRLTLLTPSYDPQQAAYILRTREDGHIRLDSLTIGTVDMDAVDTGQLATSSHAWFGGSIYVNMGVNVGNGITGAPQGDVWTQRDVRIGGGLIVGSRAEDPPVKNAIITGSLSMGTARDPLVNTPTVGGGDGNIVLPDRSYIGRTGPGGEGTVTRINFIDSYTALETIGPIAEGHNAVKVGPWTDLEVDGDIVTNSGALFLAQLGELPLESGPARWAGTITGLGQYLQMMSGPAAGWNAWSYVGRLYPNNNQILRLGKAFRSSGAIGDWYNEDYCVGKFFCHWLGSSAVSHDIVSVNVVTHAGATNASFSVEGKMQESLVNDLDWEMAVCDISGSANIVLRVPRPVGRISSGQIYFSGWVAESYPIGFPNSPVREPENIIWTTGLTNEMRATWRPWYGTATGTWNRRIEHLDSSTLVSTYGHYVEASPGYGLDMLTYSNSDLGPTLSLDHLRGVPTGIAVTEDGDRLGQIEWWGRTSAGWGLGARISTVQAGDAGAGGPLGGCLPARWSLETYVAGEDNLVERFTIGPSGTVSVPYHSDFGGDATFSGNHVGIGLAGYFLYKQDEDLWWQPGGGAPILLSHPAVGVHEIAGAYHTATGSASGQFLRASGGGAFGWAAIQVGDLPSNPVFDSLVLRGTLNVTGSATVLGNLAIGDPAYYLYKSGEAVWWKPGAGDAIMLTPPTGSGGLIAHDLVGIWHSASGLTIGNVLLATGATTFGFGLDPVVDAITAKGDLPVGTAADTIGILGAGSVGQALTVMTGTATGLGWATISAGPGGGDPTLAIMGLEGWA